MSGERPVPLFKGRRIVICDYNALLLSVTGLLRMSGYVVFQAHDGYAAQELCVTLPRVELLILNTYGTGIDVGELCLNVRGSKPGLPILHIGGTIPVGLPADVPTLAETFTADSLLLTVRALIDTRRMQGASVRPPDEAPTTSYPNGRGWSDSGARGGDPGVPRMAPPVPPVTGAAAEHSRTSAAAREAQDHLARLRRANQESLAAAPRRRTTDDGG